MDDLASEKKAGVTLLSAIAFGIGAIGFFLLSVAVYRMQMISKSSAYPTVQGVIEKSEFHYPTRPKGQKTRKAFIAYRYLVDGTDYSSRIISYADPDGEVGLSKDEIIRRYPVGKSVAVYYNPVNPADSVLSRSSIWDLSTLVMWGMGTIAAALTALYYLRKLCLPPKPLITQSINIFWR